MDPDAVGSVIAGEEVESRRGCGWGRGGGASGRSQSEEKTTTTIFAQTVFHMWRSHMLADRPSQLGTKVVPAVF